MPQDCAGFGFVYKAHPAAHIEIRVCGCNAADGPKDKQDVELFFFWDPKYGFTENHMPAVRPLENSEAI